MNNDTKTVLVTGATRGLGLAICELLAADNYRVIGVARKESVDYRKLKQSYLGKVHFLPVDLSSLEKLYNFSDEIQKRFGRLYALVNNAGIGGAGILPTMHEVDIDQIIRVNLQAPILLSKYLSRGMLLNRDGRIVNVSSIIAHTGFSGLSVYGATKAGLVGLTKSLAREFGKAGITVNCVAPGFMETEMTEVLQSHNLDSIRRRSPLDRFATTHEVAGSVLYLLTEAAGALTGSIITVDAGSTA